MTDNYSASSMPPASVAPASVAPASLPPASVADVFFDFWFMPAAFWTQWWGFYAETLNVAHDCPAHHSLAPDEAPVDVEVEEGLVA